MPLHHISLFFCEVEYVFAIDAFGAVPGEPCMELDDSAQSITRIKLRYINCRIKKVIKENQYSYLPHDLRIYRANIMSKHAIFIESLKIDTEKFLLHCGRCHGKMLIVL